MKFSTEVIDQIAEILAGEMEQTGVAEAGIMAVEHTMRSVLQKVGQKALGKYLCQAEQEEPKAVTCECGGEAEYVFRRAAVVVSVFDKVSYRRRYYVCASCSRGQAPLDRRLGLAPGQVTPGLAKLLALAGVDVAFEEGCRLVEQFLLFRVSDNTLRKETERFGALQAEEEERWKVESQDTGALQRRLWEIGPQPGRMYGSMDGAIVPLVREWRELKCLAWYRVEPVRSYQPRRHHASQVGEQNDLQGQDITYHCAIADPERFGELVWATAWRRLADLHQELVFVCDGAVWIWKLIERYFPNATQIVDWYHASQYLPPIAEAAFGKDTPQAKDWLEQARNQLWNGQIDDLIQDCQLLARLPLAAKPASQAVTYFSNNHKRMDYARFREQGYLIGSGTIESGCKQIASLRLKRAGARWTEQGAVQTAKARGAWLSGSWDSLAAKRAALPLAI
jgi:hypothetical protein